MSDERHDLGAGNRLSRRGMLKLTAAAGVAAAPVTLSPAAQASGGAEPALELPPATDAVTPFRLRIPELTLFDLRRRLWTTRWPDRETVPDGTQGAQLDRVRRLVEHWRTRYDMRRLESRLNRFPQYRTRIDGLGIHFLHVRSRHPGAVPLLLTHGWPGSVVEFLDLIDPLTDPTAHGGSAADAFHVVVPSLPGFGFSDKPTAAGWNVQRTARAWAVLMDRLGYDRYLAQGGDWGASVTFFLAKLGLPQLAGVHFNLLTFVTPPVEGQPTPEEQEALRRYQEFLADGTGYYYQQTTRPQTVGYGLTDSPVGQAAWMYEKFVDWTDSDRNPEGLLGYDRLLDAIMMYWLPATAASSARIYWENRLGSGGNETLDLPAGFTNFPHEFIPVPRIWVERIYRNLVYYNAPARGGHFGAFEQPEIFTEELRRFGRVFR